MSPALLVLAVVGAFATAVCVLMLMPGGQTSVLEARLGSLQAPDFQAYVDPEEQELQRPLAERLLTPVVRGLGRYIMRHTKTAQLDALQLLLLKAGSASRPETLLAMRVVLMPLGAAVGIALAVVLKLDGPIAFGIPLLLALLGYMYPVSSLKGRIKKRSREVRYALPGVLDLLTISMEAGLSLDLAILRVSESDTSVLSKEFQQVLNEVRLGRPRREALLSLAERSDVEELAGFVNAVVQAEPLGISVANVLRVQSEELRRRRRQRAEEAGHRAPVLMLLPMMGCIFPCIFICLLGPAVLTIINNH